MTSTAAEFRYLASNVANSDRPEYAKYFREAAAEIERLTAALSRAEAQREERDKLIEYALTVCDQFNDGLAWRDDEMRVAASKDLTLGDLNTLNGLRGVVQRVLAGAACEELERGGDA